jgi:hypothetical protein
MRIGDHEMQLTLRALSVRAAEGFSPEGAAEGAAADSTRPAARRNTAADVR